MKTGLMLIVAMSLGPLNAAAQTGQPAAEGQSLVLSASVAAGYDDDVTSTSEATPSSDPRFRTGGTFAITDMNLSYGRQTRRINFGAAASASVRRYHAIETFTADGYGGSVGMSATIAPRLRMGAHASASRSSHYTLNILPVFAEDPVSSVALPSLDYSLVAGALARHSGGVQLYYSPTRRSNVNLSYSTGESSAGERLLKLKSTAWGAAYSQGLTRYATLRLGVHRQQATYGGARRVPVDSYDIGVNYSRPLSISRRTTMRFSAGSAVVGTANRRRGTVIGHATLTHQFSRVWDLDATYNRAVGFVEGFADPAQTDSVLSVLVGRVHRRVTVTGTLGYSNGNIGVVTASSPRYTTYSGGLRTHILLYRGLFAFADYVYYQYQFKNLSTLPFGAPSRLNRQGIRTGLLFNVPLL